MSDKLLSEDMKGISRINTNSTKGWFVRIYRNGKTYSKLFSDRKYGGKIKALQRACKERDYAHVTMPPKQIKRVKKRRLTQSETRNKSGVVGVNRSVKITSKGVEKAYYQVTWSPKIGTMKNKQWSVSKYGEQDAFLRAWEYRKQVMTEIHGERYQWQNDVVDWDKFNQMLGKR